ncbi:head GIN domain-containing protein [Aequorivita flava]|uniref:Head GIN domain-containing protein n=1 Tax=Aequorivita flava TaxID=3114371 RepID=A0AB35YM58_9FLAO
MKTIRFITAMGAALLLSACNFTIGENGNGNVVTEERQVTADFTEVRGSAGLEVYLTQGSENKIVVEADENLLPLIETEINDGKLHVKTSENIGRSKSKKIHVTYTELNNIEASSGAEVKANSVVKSQNLTLRSSSGASLNAEVFTQNLMVKTSSGSDLEVSGKATSLNADASSGSELNAKKLLVVNCIAEASSGAEVTVNVQEKLETSASSGGEINYFGNPISVNSNKSSSGSVNKM